ncbi:Gfo/Idh/MocA family protein [Salinispira pacifica]|uniref:Myo-inositol 2-dehydrogenase n=1 Tax=Salinispira pacifica TaxID=1307761 RepID=V5WKY0_9SPIO|nr:Gfo/Idh/MocA family oxidoreductase [Salinispira pacifica]AHC16482.1 Myo-inositol 2-dehydrogenase [Salinispira pacifica]
MKFAIIGCGRISKKHIDAINEIEKAELVAVCDLQEDRAKKQAMYAGSIPYYTDYDHMLQNEEIDVVNVLTESGNHARHTIDIVKKYKKHIIVEKPMSLRLDDADEMIRVCDQHGVRLFVVKQNRYNLPVSKLREAIDSGRFGKLVLGTVRVRWCRPQEYYDQDSWRGTWEMDGGALTNQASHHIDLLEWMLGEPVSVYARTETMLSNIEVEDTGAAIIKFKNGAMGIVEATTATRPKDLEGSLSILGEKGSVVIGGFAVNKMDVWNFSDVPEEENTAILKKFQETPPNVYGFGHKRYIEHVIYSIENGTQALVDGLEGRKSIELINAIYESAETGKEVFLHFDPKKSKLGRSKI